MNVELLLTLLVNFMSTITGMLFIYRMLRDRPAWRESIFILANGLVNGGVMYYFRKDMITANFIVNIVSIIVMIIIIAGIKKKAELTLTIIEITFLLSCAIQIILGLILQQFIISDVTRIVLVSFLGMIISFFVYISPIRIHEHPEKISSNKILTTIVHILFIGNQVITHQEFGLMWYKELSAVVITCILFYIISSIWKGRLDRQKQALYDNIDKIEDENAIERITGYADSFLNDEKSEY